MEPTQTDNHWHSVGNDEFTKFTYIKSDISCPEFLLHKPYESFTITDNLDIEECLELCNKDFYKF